MTLAFEKLFDDVVESFRADETEVPNVFGWETPSYRGGRQNRICWVPGDPSGALGAVDSARSPGGNPRSIGTLDEIFTVYIEGCNSSNPENERAQYVATRLLFDAWYRAAYLSVRNLLKVKSAAWMVNRKTRRLGATMRVVCTLQAMIPDERYPVIAPYAVVDVELDSDNDMDTDNTSEELVVGEVSP